MIDINNNWLGLVFFFRPGQITKFYGIIPAFAGTFDILN